MKADKFKVQAHFYCGLMGEAIYSLVRAKRLQQESLDMQRDGDNSHGPGALLQDAGLFARYAFLLACNALENSSHSVLVNSGKLSSSLAEDIDRLNTLNKFEVFALIHGKSINRGDGRYAKVKEVIKCRNAFVHPKGRSIEILSNPEKAETRLSGGREYPLAFDFIEIDQVVLMTGDILSFVAWVVFDVCKFTRSNGAKLINGDIQSYTADLFLAQRFWKFDLRSLGDFRDVRVRPIVLARSNRRTAKKRRLK